MKKLPKNLHFKTYIPKCPFCNSTGTLDQIYITETLKTGDIRTKSWEFCKKCKQSISNEDTIPREELE